MKLPSTREETDKVLFELLEGNLSKSEEEFWYDYSFKNEDFAKQLALFRKMYMKEDISSYPNHAQLLRKTTLFAKLKWPVIISSGLVFLAIVAFYFMDKNSPTESIQPATPTTTKGNKETGIKSVHVEVVKIPIAKQKIQTANRKKVQATEVEQKEPVLDIPMPEEVERQIVPTDQKTEQMTSKKDSTVTIDLNGNIVEDHAPITTEIEQSKTPKKSTSIKFKVKPSRKTKTTDFNY